MPIIPSPCKTHLIARINLVIQITFILPLPLALPALSSQARNLFTIRDDGGNATFILNSDGDIAITGSLYGQSDHSEIALDPARKYFSIRDDNDRVVLAIDRNAGDLHTVKTLGIQNSSLDTAGSIWTQTNDAGTAIMTLAQSGLLQITGSFTPSAQLDEPEVLPSLDDSLPRPLSSLEDMLASYGLGIVPEPFAQLRMFYNIGDNNNIISEADLPLYDVTNIEWRLRHSDFVDQFPYEYNVNQGYKLQLGFRYVPENQTGNELRYIIRRLGEDDGYLVYNNDSPPVLEFSFDETDNDSTWTNPAWPAVEGAKIYNLDLTTSDIPESQDGWDIWDANDGLSTATTRLYLYDMHFEHPDSVPRRVAIDHTGATHAFDTPSITPMSCNLLPAGVPGVKRVFLSVYDPANWHYWRLFTGEPGADRCDAEWNGALYYDGDTSTSPTYASAGDVFLMSMVEWTTASLGKSWYTSSDWFEEKRLGVYLADGSPAAHGISNDPAYFAYINGTPQFPDLRASLMRSSTYPTNSRVPDPDHRDFDDIATSWSLTIEYNRGDQEQEITITTSTVFYPADTAWHIRNSITELRGGKATLTCDLVTSNTHELIDSIEHEFQIRGTNPADATTIAYINANDAFRGVQDVHWYGVPIASHESKQSTNAAGTNWGYFCQYNITRTLSSSARSFLGRDIGAHLRRLPNMNPDAGGTFGWGIFQLTHTAREVNGTDPKWYDHEDLWNWQDNVLEGMGILGRKRDASSFDTDYKSSSTLTLPTSVLIVTNVTTHTFTLNGTKSYHDLDTIRMFNTSNFFGYDDQEDDVPKGPGKWSIHAAGTWNGRVFTVGDDYTVDAMRDYDKYLLEGAGDE